MQFFSYAIAGGDFSAAGAASRGMKEQLKRIGAPAEAIRRTMIAAYEAEMNVVIHARQGRLEASLSDGRVDVNVIDEGPGIPDVELALTEGFSTASDEARTLGFGAGLGLPNIRRASDRFRLASTVGRGTRVSFSVVLQDEAAAAGGRSSLYAAADRCRDCLRCVTACPTKAMRVRDGRPMVLDHLCIDCACCIAACEAGALDIESTVDDLAHAHDGDPAPVALAVPPALPAGFGERVPVATAWKTLDELGCAELVSVAPYETAVRSAAAGLAASGELPWPVIAPLCPAAVNLVQLRFPSLIGHLAPLASPWEALRRARGETPLAAVASCPAQRAALAAGGADTVDILRPQALRDVLLPIFAALPDQATPPPQPRPALHHPVPGSGPSPSAPSPAPAAPSRPDTLLVTGVAHVLSVLEQIEDGLLTSAAVVEPYCCDGGCFGSPLLTEDPAVAAWRWAAARLDDGAVSPLPVPPPERPYAPRSGVRLDDDMGAAIAKLARIDALTKGLPGRDCAACGSPTCAALAEDIVLERAAVSLCPYLDDEEDHEA